MVSSIATSSSFRAACSRASCFVASTSPTLSVTSSASTSKRAFSTTLNLARNTPARRPKDPLNHDPTAVRHALPSGETLIVRRPPTPPTTSHITASASASPSSPLPVIETNPNEILPPSLKPMTRSLTRSTGLDDRKQQKTLNEADIARIVQLRSQDPFKNTPMTLAKAFGCSRTFVQMVAPLKDANVRLAKEQKQDMDSGRESWGWNKRLSRELRRERRALW